MIKKTLSFFMAIVMIIGIIPAVSAENTHVCGTPEDEYCLVCDIADKINALPIADDITINNAAVVTDQIHAIDRLKVSLDYDDDTVSICDDYYELLKLVESGNDGSGFGTNVPVRYKNAVEKVSEFGGSSLFITKEFMSADENEINVSDATVTLKIEKIVDGETTAPITLTMSTMDYIPNSLSENPDFYSANADGSGWTYKYPLPAGTYKITEVSDSGATVDGKAFVTASTTHKVGDGETETGKSAVVTLGNEDASISFYNSYSPSVNILTISTVDADSGDPLEGAHIQIINSSDLIIEEWDSTIDTHEVTGLPTDEDYTLRVDAAPDGYEIPTDITFSIDEYGNVTPTSLVDADGTILIKFTPKTTGESGSESTTIPDLTVSGDTDDIFPDMTEGKPIKDIDLNDYVSGGSGDYEFSAEKLPAGIKISPDGIISGTPAKPGNGGEVTVTVTDAEGNKLTFTVSYGRIAAKKAAVTEKNEVTTKINTAIFTRLNGFKIEIEGKGRVIVNRKTASANTSVPMSVYADRGYELSELIVTDGKGNEVDITKSGAKYLFKMPLTTAHIKVVFTEVK